MIHLDAWCTAPATQDRRFSPLLSSRRGRDTAAYFHRYAIPVNPLPDFRPNVVRNETGQSFFVFQALYPRTRARCVTSLSIISYVYKCTYEDDDDGRIHTRRESKLAFVSRFFFFFFLPIAPIEESVERRSTDCSSNGDNREGMRSATVLFCEKVW